MKLTDAGRAFAIYEAQNGSILASVALMADAGAPNGWPKAFQKTAVRAMNHAGEVGAIA